MPRALTTLAAAAILSFGIFANHVAAHIAAAALPAGTATVRLIREATIVCGGNGCNSVQTKAPKHRKFQTLGHG